MKFDLKIGIITLALFALISPINAQGGKAIVFSDDAGIHIRWSIHPEAEGYFVYRRSDNGNWQKQNLNAIPVVTDNRAIRDLLGNKADILLGIVGVSSATDDLSIRDITNAALSAEQFNLLQAFSLINPEFSKVFGLTYLDAQATGTVQYKITAITSKTEEDWVTTSDVNRAQLDALPSVEDASGEGKDQAALISWKKDLAAINAGSIVTYHVYRSNDELGPFGRINYYGILPGSISVGASAGVNSPEGLQFHLDEGLENGTPYFYQVKPVNAFGMEGYPSLTFEVVPGNTKPPSPPSDIKVKQSGKAAHLSWSHANNQLQGFEVVRSTSADGTYETVYPAKSGAYVNIRQFLDFELSPGLIYYYKVRSVNANGISGDWSHPVEYINWDRIPPAAPTGLKAITDDAGKITVTWDASPEEDVIGYHIDRATDNNFDWQFRLNMKMLDEEIYIDERPVESRTTYGYVVYAVDRSLNQSTASEMVKAQLPDITPPQTPIITSLDESAKTVTLTWTKNIEEDFDKYLIYRGENSSGALLPIGESNENNYSDNLDRDEGQFFYAVSAIDQTGLQSEKSKAVSMTRIPSSLPDAPINGEIKLEDGRITISWQSPSDKDVTGYLISRYANNNPDRRDIQQLKADDELVFTDKYVVSGKTYLYEIRSHDEAWQLSEPLLLSLKVR